MAFSHKYPKTDAMTGDGSAFTLMQFVEYKRENPNSNPTERLTGAIRLPLPRMIPDSAQFTIDGENLGLWGSSMEQFGALGNILFPGYGWNGLRGQGVLNRLNVDAAFKLLRLYAPGISDSVLGMQWNRADGLVKNPHTTAIFQGVNLRRIPLNWRFSPRSQTDADELQSILRTIKERSHPALGLAGFALEYPDQVYVTFPNTKLTPIRKSFIQDYQVTPSSGNGIALFKDGSPVEIELNMTMIEVDIITRDELQNRNNTDPDSPQAVIPNSAVDDSPVNAISR